MQERRKSLYSRKVERRKGGEHFLSCQGRQKRYLRTVVPLQPLSIIYSISSLQLIFTWPKQRFPLLEEWIEYSGYLTNITENTYRFCSNTLFFLTLAVSNNISLLIHFVKCTSNTEKTRTNRRANITGSNCQHETNCIWRNINRWPVMDLQRNKPVVDIKEHKPLPGLP